MTEEKINAFRQTDANLRNALEMDEAERPQMPADLNERLMQRMAVKEDKQPRRIVWPWIAAACVAGIMVIWLMPPKDFSADVVAENTVVEQPTHINKVEETPVAKVEENSVAKVETETPAPVATPVKAKGTKVKNTVVKRDAALLAQDAKTAQTPAAEEANKELAVAEPAKLQEKMVTLTERDIPITRPENYQYTPEEIALLKKQANEAYLKWAELELEISKYNLEQASSK